MIELTFSGTCIYCGQPGPFSNEHMFPAGLGGDDSRFLLKDLVCARCNTEVFSKLEASFIRSSPTALGRVFLQARGRGKGKNARVVRLDARATTINHPEYGAVEAELVGAGRPTMLMQLLFLDDGNVAFIGGDHADPHDFLTSAHQSLGNEVHVVEKIREGAKYRYDVTTLSWQDGAYQSRIKGTALKIPHACIWREPSAPLASVGTPARHPAFYQRGRGQFVCRADPHVSIAYLLTQARKGVQATIHRDMPPYVALERPEMLFSMSVDLDASHRVLGKIGFNVLTYLCGETYVRHPAFNATRQAVLTGEPEINYRHLSDQTELAAFSGVPPTRHVIALSAAPSGVDTFHVAVLMRLYGVAYAVELAANAPRPPTLTAEFVVIEYNAHTIEALNGVEFIRRYPPNLTQTFSLRSRAD